MKANQNIMRTLIVGGVFATSSLFTSCSEKVEGCTDSNATNYDSSADSDNGSCVYSECTAEVTEGGVNYCVLAGSVTADLTLDETKNYMISGGLFVKTGATLTIPEGMTLYAANDGSVPFVSVEQGAMIKAVGTASKPIVFTSIKSLTNTADRGDWGGIILNGYAKINKGATAQGEGGTGVYGGTDNADNSGELKYVRVEYAGKLLSTDNELNGFSFNGCGSATKLSYLQSYMGNDDGFEFFGGTASMDHAVSTGNGDDSFDWTYGWSGNGDSWYVEQAADAGDRGIEADNNSSDNGATPMSKPTITNITLIGRGSSEKKDAIKLRAGTAAIIDGVYMDKYQDGIEIETTQSFTNVTNNDLSVTNVTAGSDISTDLKFSGMKRPSDWASDVTFDLQQFLADSTANKTALDAAVATGKVNLGSGSAGAGTTWQSGWTKAL